MGWMPRAMLSTEGRGRQRTNVTDTIAVAWGLKEHWKWINPRRRGEEEKGTG